MSYIVLSRETGRREVRRVDLPIVGWDTTRGGTLASTAYGACFVVKDGDLYSWFREDPYSEYYQQNSWNELGDNRTEGLFTPTQITQYIDINGNIQPLPQIERVAAGETHGLALTSKGSVIGWGDVFYGQLGFDGTAEYNPWGVEIEHTPARIIPDRSGISFIAASNYNSAFVTKNGIAYATGQNGMWMMTSTQERLDLPNPVLEIAGGYMANGWGYVDQSGNAYTFKWWPTWYSGEPNVLEHAEVWTGGGIEQVRTTGDWDNPVYFRHEDGRVLVGGAFLDGVTARHIYNGGYFVGEEGNLSSLMDIHSALGAGPFTETGGIVSRNGDEIYTFDPDWNNKTRAI